MAPSSQLSVVSAPHPLLTAHSSVDLPVGLHLDQILEAVQPDPILRHHAHIFLDGAIVPRADWRNVTPEIGQQVTIRVVPTGGEGGKNPLRIILSIAVLIVGTAFGGPLGTALFGFAQGSAVGAAIGTALITTAGGLLINAIVPPPQPTFTGEHEGKKASQVFAIHAARNRPRPFAPVPVILGRHRMVPPLGAQTYTEIRGGSQYLRMLAVWGYGPLTISDLKIGETPIGDFDDVEIETREGRSTDDPITLYTRNVFEERFSILLSSADGWHTKTTRDDTEEVILDFATPRGVSQFRDDGTRIAALVRVDIEYRRVGDANWVSYTTLGSPHFSDASTTPKPRAYIIPNLMGAPEQYEVRVRRFTPDSTSDRVFDDVYWTVLRSVRAGDPITFDKPLALTAIRIRATDQLSGIVDRLNATVSSHVLDWDGTNWAEAETSNPASLFRHVLQGVARDNRTPDSRLDLPSLQAWHDFCVAKNYEYNGVIDYSSSVLEALREIAVAGRASPAFADGKWGLAVDTGTQLPVQHFTPRNSTSFRASRAFSEVPDALRVRFNNRDEGWRQDERLVYRDGFDKTSAQKFATLEAPGITDPDHVYRFGRFHLAQILLRRELWTCELDFEYIVASRGDRVLLTHDVLLVGQKAARIKSATVDSSGKTTAIEIDEQVTMVSGVNYGVSIRTPADAAIKAQVDTVAGTTTSLTFATPVAAATFITAGDLLAFGTFGQETIDGLIVSVEPATELTARVSIMPWQSPGVYDSETGPIPAYVTGLTPLPADRSTLVIVNLRSDESALRKEGATLVPTISVDVLSIDDLLAIIDAQIRPVLATGATEEGTWANAEVRSRGSAYIEIGGVNEGSAYDLRFRWNAGVTLFPGAWTEELNHTVVGQTTLPGPATNLQAIALQAGFRATWTNPDVIDFAAMRIYVNETNDSSTARRIGTVNADYYIAQQLTEGVLVYIWAESEDRGGRLGTLAGPVTVTPLAPGAAAAILIGTGVPDNNDGKDGDIYVQADGSVWRKAAGVWTDTGIDLTGPSSATIRSGDIADGATPTVNGTTVGDVFLATDGRWWRWDGTAWILQGNLTGRDGPGVEFVFQTTTTDTAPTLVQLAADVMQLPDQVPTGWEDDPQGVDETNRFEWVSQRARDSAGVWGNFSTPAQWAVYIPGQDGPGVEFVFQTTTTDTAPTLVQLAADVMQLPDQVPTGWSDDPQGVDETNRFEWVSQRARDSAGVWGNFSTPAQWAVYIPGQDGPGVEFVFRTTTTDTAPALAQLAADVMQLPDQIPTGWEDDPQGVDETNRFEWVSQRARDSAGVWGNFSTPAQWAVYIPGPEGPIGPDGQPGQPGQGGPPGAIGDKGPMGPDGFAGQQGPPGAIGDTGPMGIIGFPGQQGNPGGKGGLGDTGGKGQPGAGGTPGGSGAKGDLGVQGAKGLPGAAGNPGAGGQQVFVYYTNAPADTTAADLVPLQLLNDGRWTTASGYFWYGDATQVPN